MSLNPGIKLILAAVSGLLCAFCWGWFPNEEDPLGWLGLYGLSGLIFAAGVLGPYLNWDSSLRIRGSALVLASILSYWCAVHITMAWDGPTWGPEFEAIIAASVVGAGIVWLVAAVLVPFHCTTRYALLGLAAGVIGGLLFYFSMFSTNLGFFPSFVSWHLTMCIALLLSKPGERPIKRRNKRV